MTTTPVCGLDILKHADICIELIFFWSITMMHVSQCLCIISIPAPLRTGMEEHYINAKTTKIGVEFGVIGVAEFNSDLQHAGKIAVHWGWNGVNKVLFTSLNTLSYFHQTLYRCSLWSGTNCVGLRHNSSTTPRDGGEIFKTFETG